MRVDFGEDTKYAGRVVSRRDLEAREGELVWWKGLGFLMTFAPIIGSDVTFNPSELKDSPMM